MPQLQKLSKGSSFRQGREVVAMGSGRSAAVASGASVTFTYTIKEDTWINKLVVTADDGLVATPVDMSLTQMYSGDPVCLQMHSPLATNNPGLGFWVRTGDVLQVTCNNDNAAAGCVFNASFTSI